MDIFSEVEVHSEIVTDKNANWKPFKLSDCAICGKKPSILKDLDIEGSGRYRIKCCGLEAKAETETKAIYVWNTMQSNLTKKGEES